MGKAQGYEGNGSASGLWLIPTVKIAWGGVDQRVSDLLCISNMVHASLTKEHEDNDDYEGSIRRAA